MGEAAQAVTLPTLFANSADVTIQSGAYEDNPASTAHVCQQLGFEPTAHD